MSSSSNTTTNVINPKPCNYNCGTRIYWNTATSEYWEVFTKKKHICYNRVNKPSSVPNTALLHNSFKQSIFILFYLSDSYALKQVVQRCF